MAKWEICGRCGGDGGIMSYDEEGVGDLPIMVNCFKCNGSGKVEYKSPEEQQQEYEDQKLSLLEDGIYPGTQAWNDYMD